MPTERKTNVFLKEQDVRKVVWQFANGITAEKIAHDMNISICSVYFILNGKYHRRHTGLSKDNNNRVKLRNKALLIGIDDKGFYTKVYPSTRPGTVVKVPVSSFFPKVVETKNEKVVETKNESVELAKKSISKAKNLTLKIGNSTVTDVKLIKDIMNFIVD